MNRAHESKAALERTVVAECINRKNKKNIRVIMEYLALTGHQSIAQRGHCKDQNNVGKVST